METTRDYKYKRYDLSLLIMLPGFVAIAGGLWYLLVQILNVVGEIF